VTKIHDKLAAVISTPGKVWWLYELKDHILILVVYSVVAVYEKDGFLETHKIRDKLCNMYVKLARFF
jgi:hypothetical protein